MATSSSYRLKGKAKDSYLECILDFPLTRITSDEHLEAAGEVMDGLLARAAGLHFMGSIEPCDCTEFVDEDLAEELKVWKALGAGCWMLLGTSRGNSCAAHPGIRCLTPHFYPRVVAC